MTTLSTNFLMKRRKIKQHEELSDPRYRSRVEKSYKVKKREQEEKESKNSILEYIKKDTS